MKRALAISGVLLCVSFGFAYAQTETPPGAAPAIGPSAIWSPGTRLLNAIGKSCREQAAQSNFEDCFAEQMETNGASPDAVSFTRSASDDGILTDYRDTGRIDVAWVLYPFRLSENNGLLLVNGDPPTVDVDDPALWPQTKLSQDPVYASLYKKYPMISVWPGPRTRNDFPRITKLSVGGQNFMIGYYLQNGCQTCARLGTVSFGFHFDPMGKFAGVYIEDVEADAPSRGIPK